VSERSERALWKKIVLDEVIHLACGWFEMACFGPSLNNTFKEKKTRLAKLATVFNSEFLKALRVGVVALSQ